MSLERHQRVKQIFHRAADLDPSARSLLLDSECGNDPELRAEVEELIARHEGGKASGTPAPSDREIADDLSGKTVGRYQIVSLVGSGSMGVVYKALDRKLGRMVALKFLSAEATVGGARQRFLREARAAAALDDPNICTVHDIGEADGRLFISMAYLEGRTLADALRSGPIEVDQALDFALQIGRGLEAAHSKGIVHRDVKPANLMITQSSFGEAVIKIMDFGVAAFADGEALTNRGALVGTVAYMSPEQARGEEVDQLTDIWALGVVLYEMITGRRPFRAAADAAIVQAILHDEPERMGELRTGVPIELERIVAKAVKKEVGERYQDLTGLVADLEELQQRSDPVRTPRTLSRRWSKRPYAHPRWAIVAGVAFVVLASLAFWFRSHPSRAPQQLSARPLTSSPLREMEPALSPDGRLVAFSAGEEYGSSDIYVQLVAGGQRVRLTDNAEKEGGPVWSPDGLKIAYLKESSGQYQTVMLISALGGEAREISDVRAPVPQSFARPGRHIDWAPDGESLIVVDGRSVGEPFRIARLDFKTREKTQLTDPENGILGDISPRISPDGRRLALSRCAESVTCDILVFDLDSHGVPVGAPRVFRGGDGSWNASPAWTPDGKHLIFSSGEEYSARLWSAEPDDPGSAQPLGDASSLTAADIRSTGGEEGWRVVFMKREVDTDIRRVPLVLRDGWPVEDQSRKRSTFAESSYRDHWPVLSPDDTKLVFASDRSGRRELWTIGIDGSDPLRLTDLREPFYGPPAWSPDGERIVFFAPGPHCRVYVIGPNARPPQVLFESESPMLHPSWSLDGDSIYYASRWKGDNRIWKRPLSGGEPALVSEVPMYSAFERRGGGLIATLARLGPGRGNPVLYVPADGGPPQRLGDFEIFSASDYEVHDEGVCYVSGDSLYFYKFAAEESRPVARYENSVGLGLTVTKDFSVAFITEDTRDRIEIMVADNLEQSLP